MCRLADNLGFLRFALTSKIRGGGSTAMTTAVVDDGLATGVTARAAVEALRRQAPGRLILAAPVCAAQAAEMLRPEVDELVCLETPSNLMAIGLWYQDFYQVPDEEV